MNTHNFKGNQYQLLIENGDLILQGMHEDIIFMGAWDEIYKELEDEFWRSEFCQIRSLSDYVGYEQEGRIVCYLFNHKGEGTVLPHCAN